MNPQSPARNKNAVELRALKSGAVLVGHYDDPSTFHKHAKELNAAGYDIYSPINPLRSELLTDINSTPAPGNAAGEGAISARAWLPYDIDSVRGKGQTATDDQRELARQMAVRVLTYWTDRGVTPKYVDSGNGFQVLVPINIPNDSGTTALVKRILEAHKRDFETPGAKLDVLFDAPRIMRVVGYTNWKGDGPHRTVTRHPDSRRGKCWRRSRR